MKLPIEDRIKYLEIDLKRYKKILGCDHVFFISEGDNISTTGPTGLYKQCEKCDYKEGVGYKGENGDVFYAEEEKKQQKLFKKAQSLGLTENEIRQLKDVQIK